MTLSSSHVSTSCVHTYYQIEYALKGNVFSCTDMLRAMSKLMYTLDFSQSSYIHVARTVGRSSIFCYNNYQIDNWQNIIITLSLIFTAPYITQHFSILIKIKIKSSKQMANHTKDAKKQFGVHKMDLKRMCLTISF